MELEEKRLQKLENTHRRLEAKDQYKWAIEQREIDKTANRASQGRDQAQRQQAEQEARNLEDVSGVDETTRLKMSVDFSRLANFLDIGAGDFESGLDQMKYVLSWAQESTGKRDILENLKFIKKTRDSYGFREVGLTGLKKLYMYARLDEDARRIKEEKQLLKNG